MKKGWHGFLISLIWFQILSAVVVASPLGAASVVEPVPVMISAVKTDGGKDKEYVELYNPAIETVDVSGWVVEYVLQLSSAAVESCKTDSWSGVANTVKQWLFPAGSVIGSHERLRVFLSAMNDDKQGSVRLVQYSGADETTVRTVHDLVGWGSETMLSTCSEQAVAEIAKDNQTLIRCVRDGAFRDTDDNAADFFVVGDDGASSVDNPPECPSEVVEPTPTVCEEVVVSEILPNPSGVDTGKEYIELYNPTLEPIVLQGCELSISGSTKIFVFVETDVLTVGEYKAFYDTQTGLTLPNSAGGEVVLASAQTEYAYTYPANMKDDETWAVIEATWQATDNPTPHAPNEPMSVLQVAQEIEDDGDLVSCSAGKYRNPETNRCRSIVATLSALLPCNAGHERNPATNRCRNIANASAALAPCAEGQERNPATNRCRSILAASTELNPCAEGQERNHETNRCRTIVAAKSGATISDDKTSNSKKPLNYLLLGFVGVLALGYGVYEYRQDIRNKWHTLRSRVRL